MLLYWCLCMHVLAVGWITVRRSVCACVLTGPSWTAERRASSGAHDRLINECQPLAARSCAHQSFPRCPAQHSIKQRLLITPEEGVWQQTLWYIQRSDAKTIRPFKADLAVLFSSCSVLRFMHFSYKLIEFNLFTAY